MREREKRSKVRVCGVVRDQNTLSVQKKWREVYADDEKMQMMYGGFKSWLNKYGKDIRVRKHSNKTLHSVMVRWTSKDNDMSRKTLESESNISKEE